MLDRTRDTGSQDRAARGKRLRRLGSRLSYWVIVALALVIAAPMTLNNSTLRLAVQNVLFDQFQRWKPRVYADPPAIRIVEIDDESLAKLGRWPWPRARLGEIIEKLTAAGAAVVALDILLYDPGDPEDDAQFAKAIEGRPVVLGQFFTDNANTTRLPAKAGFAFAGDDPTPFAYRFRGVLTPLPAFAQAAAGVGFINWAYDNDRVVRRVPLVGSIAGALAPSLAMEALRVAQGASSYTIKSSNASGENGFGAHTGMVALQNGDAVAPVGPRGDFRIHFAADDPRLRMPGWKVLEPDADLSTFQGAIVFVGTSAELLFDIVATPLSASAPGVRQHAEIVGQLLTGDMLNRPDWARGGEFLYSVALSLLIAVALPFLPAIAKAALGLACLAGSFYGSWWVFSRHGLLLDPIMPTIANAVVYILGVLTLFAQKQGEAREIRGIFSLYVAPAVVGKLISDPSLVRLGGEERRVTVMFSDLRGFTTLSEGKSATELTRFLNDYLTPMTDEVLSRLGTVDKYIGDAIMAFWNAPIDDERHAIHAVEAALGMRAALERLNAQWAAEAADTGRPFTPVQFGVGLNTGLACVGNLGSRAKFNYSLIGDEVNVASRLESATKQFGVDIVASEATRAEAPDFAWLEVDAVVFKNKTTPVGVHALAGDAEMAASEDFLSLADGHARMMAHYRRRDFAGARDLARLLEPRAPEAVRGLYAFQAQRFARLIQSAPAADWRAVLALEEK